ncbi:MAG: diaminopimelate epimerase [Campylobacterales bacterium]|nr:diaminopimelate epimerase [Campylobacterales bacterium]
MDYLNYDASGNTFVIFHSQEKKDYSDLAIQLCKKEDVDGLIVVLPHDTLDFQWLFYNNDGSSAAMCGNGTRAVAHYAYTNKLALSKMSFLTGAGVIRCSVTDDIVETTMTKPVELENGFDEFGFSWYKVDTGVPHLVTIVDDIEKFDLQICLQMRHKHNANVNFAKVQNNQLFVRTYERGVEDETQACGTGMVASFLRANMLGLIGDCVDVYPKSKELLSIRKDQGDLFFKGAVKITGSGQF